MFQKVHLRLTLLCAGITIIILLIMSSGWLYVSEKSLRDNSFISFQNDMNTLVSNLEQQTVISGSWLKNMEGNGKYLIWLLDSGIPFLHNRQNQTSQALYEEACAFLDGQPELSGTSGYNSAAHTELLFHSSATDKDYYACAASLTRGQGNLQMLVLAPLSSLEAQIGRQRLLFLCLDLAGTGALLLFSWFFTKRLLQPLEENQRQQARFVASASHELRTPLSVMLSCIAASRRGEPEERLHFLEAAENEGKRMSRLIHDMFLLSKADTQTWSIRLEPVEADTLLLDTYETFLPLAEERRIRLSVSLPEEELPPCLCDSERIRQVLGILLDNALCYTPAGGRVCLSLSFTQQTFAFSVADNGPGISEEDKKHIFERFYRADASRRDREHFGLGLCIASEIIKAHRGRLTVSGAPGGGSVFTFYLS